MRIPIIIVLFIALCAYGGHRYTCHITHACCATENGQATDSKKKAIDKPIAETKEVVEVNEMLYSYWSKQDVNRNNKLFGPYKDNLLTDFDAKKSMLKITGYYYGDEANTTTFDNLGLARANEIKKKYIDAGYKNNIQIAAKKLDGSLADKSAFFSAADLEIVAAEKVESRVEEKDGKIIFYFPYNSSDPKLDANITSSLSAIVAGIKDNSQKVFLTGHTDSRGDDNANMRLSNSRANIIKDILISKGISADRITSIGKGETAPQAGNESEEGRALNRRVELILN